jgi:hypothetical protein
MRWILAILSAHGPPSGSIPLGGAGLPGGASPRQCLPASSAVLSAAMVHRLRTKRQLVSNWSSCESILDRFNRSFNNGLNDIRWTLSFVNPYAL